MNFRNFEKLTMSIWNWFFLNKLDMFSSNVLLILLLFDNIEVLYLKSFSYFKVIRPKTYTKRNDCKIFNLH